MTEVPLRFVPSVVTVVRTFMVYDGPDAVLSVRDEPGPITSTAPRPPGVAPVLHPFLSAAALDGGQEARLRTILNESDDLEGFLTRLRAHGYHLTETTRPAR